MNKINFGIIFRILGILLCFEALFMLIPTIVAFVYEEHDRWAFLFSVLLTLLIGSLLTYCLRNSKQSMNRRDGILLGTSVWVVFALMGMFPFMSIGTSFTDSIFETVSGITTTGATIYENIDSLPHGILLWRSMLQWIGGIGIILFTVAVLPMLNHRGGMFLLSTEVSGIGQDKLSPRISQTAIRLWACYFTFTCILCFLLYAGPMDMFDAICHSLTTMGTGGFSTHQDSIAYYGSPYTEYVITIFTFIGGINFAIIYRTVMSDHKSLIEAEQVRWYAAISLICTTLITAGLFINGIYPSLEECFRKASFQVCTIMSSTGFATADYIEWGPFFTLIILLLMFYGACAGSTSGGAKIDRMVILTKNARNEFYRVLHPNVIRPVVYNGKVLPHETVSKVLAFTIMYVIVGVTGAILLTIQGVSLGEAAGCALSSISNTGPALGSAGPSGTYALLPDCSKWTMLTLMLIGRLEIFTVLILFTPMFWKK